MQVRAAIDEDAEAMSAVLRAIIADTGRERPHDSAFVRATYIGHPDRIACSVAVDDAGIVRGFQSLRLARDGNPYGTPVGFGIIGTHISPSASRRGVGRKLFAVTRSAARAAGLTRIDATIGEANARALGYYEAMGFRTYRTSEGFVSKAYEVALES